MINSSDAPATCRTRPGTGGGGRDGGVRNSGRPSPIRPASSCRRDGGPGRSSPAGTPAPRRPNATETEVYSSVPPLVGASGHPTSTRPISWITVPASGIHDS